MQLTKTLGLTLATLLMAGTAFAHDGGMARPTFAQIDTNADGAISLEEMQAQHDKRFTDADTDKNGELSDAEMAASHPNGDAARGTRIFKALDADNSGGLSKAEVQNRGGNEKVHFAAMDADSNGSISQAEFDAMGGKGGPWQRPLGTCGDNFQMP